MFFTVSPDIHTMCPRPDSALSETMATTLIIILVVILAVIVVALISGIPLLPNKPVLAAFSAGSVMGTGNVPVIRLYQVAGAPLIQEYPGKHTAINGTKVKLVSPDGKLFTVLTADSMTGNTVEKGEPFYLFYYNTGVASDAPYMWITNDPSRVFNSAVQPFTPHGTWKLMITEEKDTNMIIYQQDIKL
jgi:hypothetical protein